MSSNNRKFWQQAMGFIFFWKREKGPITNSMWMNLKRELLHETIFFLSETKLMNELWMRCKVKKPRSFLKAYDDAGFGFIWLLIDLTRDFEGRRFSLLWRSLFKYLWFILCQFDVWSMIITDKQNVIDVSEILCCFNRRIYDGWMPLFLWSHIGLSCYCLQS